MKKIGLLALAIVLSLGLLGVGFANWTETLEIGQNPTETGELDVEFTECACSDNDEALGENGGTVECVLKDGSDIEPDGSPVDSSLAEITVKNAYPGYKASCDLTIRNNGTIPAKLKSVRLDLLQFSGSFTVNLSMTVDGIKYGLTAIPLGYELPVGEWITIDVEVEALANASELYSHTFTADVKFGQVNE